MCRGDAFGQDTAQQCEQKRELRLTWPTAEPQIGLASGNRAALDGGCRRRFGTRRSWRSGIRAGRTGPGGWLGRPPGAARADPPYEFGTRIPGACRAFSGPGIWGCRSARRQAVRGRELFWRGGSQCCSAFTRRPSAGRQGIAGTPSAGPGFRRHVWKRRMHHIPLAEPQGGSPKKRQPRQPRTPGAYLPPPRLRGATV